MLGPSAGVLRCFEIGEGLAFALDLCCKMVSGIPDFVEDRWGDRPIGGQFAGPTAHTVGIRRMRASCSY